MHHLAPQPVSEPFANPTALIGRVVARRFRIENVLDRGAMGTVYRAEQLGVGRPVAIKVLRPTDLPLAVAVQRFEREARIISRLRHPNTVPGAGRVYIAMEYLDGRTLARTLRQHGKLSVEDVIHVARQVAKSLAEAHAQGIVHRDLKPQNIFVTRLHGERGFIKVLDFGVARLMEDPDGDCGARRLTQTGHVIGTLRYMSPEQAMGYEVDGRTDLCALGAVMYELLTGAPVYQANSLGELAGRIMHAVPPPVPGTIEESPRADALLEIVMRCLERDKDARFQTADDVLEALDGLPCPDRAPAPTVIVPPNRIPPHAASTRPVQTTPHAAATQIVQTAPADPDILPFSGERRLHTVLNPIVKTALVPRLPVAEVVRPPRSLRTLAGITAVVAALVTATAIAATSTESIEPVSATSSPKTSPRAEAGSSLSKTPQSVDEAAAEPPVVRVARATESEVGPRRRAVVAGAPRAPVSARRVSPEVGRARSAPEAAWTRRALVMSQPDGAVVRMRGRVVGRTPHIVEWSSDRPLPTVSIARAGYKTRRVRVDRAASVQLRRASRPPRPGPGDPYRLPR